MTRSQQESPVSITELIQAAIRRLAWLRTKMLIGNDIAGKLYGFHAILESLPLMTSEFALARNRLNNAIQYLKCAQRGAASYELRLLEGSLRYWARSLACAARR